MTLHKQCMAVNVHPPTKKGHHMDTDSTRWLKLRSGSEIRGPEGLLTDDVAQKVGYAFACWLAERTGRPRTR